MNNPIEIEWDSIPFDPELTSFSMMAISQLEYAKSAGVTTPFDVAYVKLVVDSPQLSRHAKLQALAVVIESVHTAFKKLCTPVS